MHASEGDLKEAFIILGRMEKPDRIAFLQWCLREAVKSLGHQPGWADTTGETLDVWQAVLGLTGGAGLYNLELKVVFEKLGEVAKRGYKWPHLARSSRVVTVQPIPTQQDRRLILG